MGFAITKNFDVNQVTENDFLNAFGEDLEKFENTDEEVIKELEKEENKEENFFEDTENQEKITPENKKKIAKFNEKTSQIIVNLFDKFMSFALSVYSLSDNIEEYKIDSDDFSEIVEMVSLMLPEDRKVFPLWLQLTITASMTWSPLMLKAHRDRKETIQLREEKKKNEEHKLKIRELEVALKEKEVNKKEDKN